MADKFPFFASYYEALKELPPEEFKAVMVAMCERAFNETEVELDGTAKGFYTLIKPIIEKSLSLSEIRSEQGKKGGRPSQDKASEKQTESKSKANVKQMESYLKADKDKDKEKDKDIKRKTEQKEKVAGAPRFVKPTVEQVAEYCRERGNSISAQSFVDFYESKGWKVGSNPMKDWKACVRTWENRRKDDRASPSPTRFNNFTQRSYTSSEMDELERQLLDN